METAPGGVHPSPRTIRAYTDDGALLAAFLARQGMPTAAASIRREHVEAVIAAELEPTAVIRHRLPVFTITGEVVLWQQTFLISPREQSRAAFDGEPHAGINEVVYYPLGCGTIKFTLFAAMDNQPQGAANRKVISFSDSGGCSFINDRDPAVY